MTIKIDAPKTAPKPAPAPKIAPKPAPAPKPQPLALHTKDTFQRGGTNDDSV